MTAAQFGTSLIFFAIDADSSGDNVVSSYVDIVGNPVSSDRVKEQGLLILELKGTASEAQAVSFKSGSRVMAGPLTLSDAGKGLDLTSQVGLFLKGRGEDFIVNLDAGQFGGCGCGVLQ